MIPKGYKFGKRKLPPPYSKEHRGNISRALKGKSKPKFTAEHCKNISLAKKGIKTKSCSLETRKKISEALKGERHFNWKGGFDSLNKKIRKTFEYKLWREKIFKRDEWSCKFCGIIGGTLNIDHHPISYGSIMVINNIKTLEDAIKCKKLWDINNGRTLCDKCHKNTENYGNRNRKHLYSLRFFMSLPNYEIEIQKSR